MKTIDITRLRELFTYDQVTGELRWIAKPYVQAGYLRPDGYRAVAVDGSAYKAHRIAWALHYGEWPVDRVDHINRDPSDNRIINLRQVTHAQNIANSQSKMLGRAKGGYWHKQRKCWTSNITVGGKKKYLGIFKTEAEASAAFQQAANQIYGVFARVEAKPCGS